MVNQTVDYLLQVDMKETLDEITERVVSVADPKRVLIFGSCMTGEVNTDSDMDILVIVKGPIHRRKLAQKIYRNLHGIRIPVDVIVATEHDIEQYGDKVGSILRPALFQGKVIYEAEG